jgi:hypothetical protein
MPDIKKSLNSFQSFKSKTKQKFSKLSLNNWSAIIVVALVIIGIGFFAYNKTRSTVAEESTASKSDSCLEGELFDKNTGEPCLGAVDKNAIPSTGALGYEEATDLYLQKRFLLTADCEARPDHIKVKVSGTFLVGNNSQKTLEVTIPGRSAILLPYHYMLSKYKEPGEFYLTCNGKTVGKINVEARQP